MIAKGNAESDVTELDRLSFTVRRIDTLCAVVPAESYKSTPNGELTKNIAFKGIKTGKFTLESFRHFRDIPEHVKLRKRVEQEGSINFLETLENDIPSGSWSLKTDDSKLNVSTLFHSHNLISRLLWLQWAGQDSLLTPEPIPMFSGMLTSEMEDVLLTMPLLTKLTKNWHFKIVQTTQS